MIKIKYFSEDYPRLEKISQGDWIDLRVDRVVDYSDKRIYNINPKFKMFKQPMQYRKGDVLFLGLGVAMQLPKGYEAHLLPRSSTFKKTGFILTNGKGIIDNSYSGDEDEWKVMVYCTRDGEIKRFDRLFQFRLVKNQEKVTFKEVDRLSETNRGGFGSTDKED